LYLTVIDTTSTAAAATTTAAATAAAATATITARLLLPSYASIIIGQMLSTRCKGN